MHRQGNLKSLSIGTRIISFLWDYVIISGYIILLFGVFYLAQPLLIPQFTASPLSAEITGFLLITCLYIFILPYMRGRNRTRHGENKKWG